MNSQDRRKDRRRWRYKVDTPFVMMTGVEDMQDEYDAIFAWCQQMFGTDVRYCGWRDREWGERWEFDDSKKAALFALRWSK